MPKAVNSLIELIGNTPMLRPNNYIQNFKIPADLLLKLEYFNPLSSVKDRIGHAMVKAAEESGDLKEGTIIIEPTSGNTGIGLAFVAAAKGYRLILTMPDTMSVERRNLLNALGAELVLTAGNLGMNGAIDKADELHAQIPNSLILHQFKNKANPEIHRLTTAEEIWADTEGKVDIFVAGVGSGGTITGVGEGLKKKNPAIQIVAIEPLNSPVLSGGLPGAHKIQGIGPGFIADNYNPKVVDEIFKVSNEDAIHTSQELARREGLLVGFSSGAAAYAATRIAFRPENAGKTIIALMPDTGERYLTTELFQYNKKYR